MNALTAPATPPPDIADDASLDAEAFDAAERARKEGDRRRRAYWIVAGVTLVLAVSLLAVAFFVENRSLYRPVEELNRRLTDEGLPTSWEGVRASAPRPPDELDGTAAWEKFAEEHPYIPMLFLDESRPGEPTIEERFAKVEADSATWRADLRKLADSGTYRLSAYDRNWLRRYDYLCDCDAAAVELSLCNFLTERARYLREIGDADEAADSLALSLAVAKNGRYEPFQGMRWGSVYSLSRICQQIEKLLDERELSPERWAELQQALERCAFQEGTPSAALHELLFVRDQAIESSLSWEQLGPIEERVARHALVRRLDLADRHRRAQALSPLERLETARRLDVDEDRLDATPGPLENEATGEFVHRSRTYPTYVCDGFLDLELYQHVTELRRRATIAAIACRRHTIERGELPDDWSDLVAFEIVEPPTNLWTGDPMTLTTEGEVVYIEFDWPDEAVRYLSKLPTNTSDPIRRFRKIAIPHSPRFAP